MKRYVKELYSDLKKELIKLGSERKCEYLETALELDKILRLAEKGYLTDREAVNALMTSFDKEYYS